MRYLIVDIGCIDFEVRSFRQQVSNVRQERLVDWKVDYLTSASLMPSVDARLHLIPLLQELTIVGGEIVHDSAEA